MSRDELLGVRRGVEVGDAEDRRVSADDLLLHLLQHRFLCRTRLAPRSEYVHHDDLPAQAREILAALAAEDWHFQQGGWGDGLDPVRELRVQRWAWWSAQGLVALVP